MTEVSPVESDGDVPSVQDTTTPRGTPPTTRRERSSGGVVVSLLLGAAAGAAGVWVMDRVGWFMYDNEDVAALQREHHARPGNLDVAHAAAGKAAALIGSRLPDQPNVPGMVVHYALGVLPGAVYGVLRRRVPAVRAGSGAAYGLALFVIMDETAAPLLGIAAGPSRYPWQAHARGAVAHLVLGVTTETVLRIATRTRRASRP